VLLGIKPRPIVAIYWRQAVRTCRNVPKLCGFAIALVVSSVSTIATIAPMPGYARNGRATASLCCVLIATIFASDCVAVAQEIDLDKLVEIATRHHLPMPPVAAPLVLAHTQSWSVLGGQSTSRDPAIYSPAFLLSSTATGSVVVLRGARRETIEPQREPLWRKFSLDRPEPRLGHEVSFDRLSVFVCAIQCAARNDRSNALALWQEFAKAQWLSDAEVFDEHSARTDPPLLLGRCIFDHLRSGLLQAQSNWEEIHAAMKVLFQEFPALRKGARSVLFEDLTTTINTKAPRAASVEGLLLEWSRQPSFRYDLFEGGENTGDKAARQIISRGRDAIPDLIALLDDRRITAHEVPQINNAPARIRRVGELAGILIQEMGGIKGNGFGGLPNNGELRAWWEANQKDDEQTLLRKAVFTREGNKITWVNEAPARTLAQRYPETLVELWDDFSAHAAADAQPFALAQAVAASSSLSKERRVEILSNFARKGMLAQQRPVLQVLAQLDQAACIVLLRPILAKLTNDSTGPYWTCPEAALSHVIMQIEDDQIWKEWVRVAKRSSVGLRMEMMSPMCYTYIGETNRARRLAFLQAFFNDRIERDKSGSEEKFQGPSAGFTFPRMEVRNLAALKAAAILALPDRPDELWTAAEWGVFRENVARRLSRETLPELE
jgi:hypothetical protein